LGGEGKYTRKSITFINTVYLAGPQARKLTPEQTEYLLQTIKQRLSLPRFDENPLPPDSKLMYDFIQQANNRDSLALDDIAELLNTTFVPKIAAIIDEYAEKRASELVDETSRAAFIATKAKELGITAENLEQIYNSAYIYLPYLNGVKRYISYNSSNEKKSTVNYSLEGGIIWFKIDFENNRTRVRSIIKSKTTSMGMALTEKHFLSEGQYVGAETFAYRSAVRNFARNLEIITRSYPAFTLSIPIAEVEGATVRFSLGSKEGLHVDDKFIVGELMEDDTGGVTFESQGFIRVTQVANNKTDREALSVGQGVIVQDWAPGMLLNEHPRLPLELYFIAGSFPYRLTQPDYASNIPVTNLSSSVELGIGVSYDLGRWLSIPQLLTLLEFQVGSASATIENWYASDTRDTFIFGFGVGLSKRTQFRRFAAVGQVLLGGRSITINDVPAISDSDTLNIIASAFVLGLGLDYALDIDWTVGLHYRLTFGSNDVWTVTNSEGSADYDGPELKISGGAWLLEISWNPPTLGIDPLDAIRGLAGI